MTSENKHELSQEELDKVTGGQLQVGETYRFEVCPLCMCDLEHGKVTRPEWIEYDPELKRNVSVYVDGYVCPKCGYNVDFSGLPFFKVTENGLEFVPQKRK